MRIRILSPEFWFRLVCNSVAEPEPPGAATLRVKPEPTFLLAGAAFFKAAPAASFWQAKKESRFVVTKHDLMAIYYGKCDLKKTCINNLLFMNSK